MSKAMSTDRAPRLDRLIRAHAIYSMSGYSMSGSKTGHVYRSVGLKADRIVAVSENPDGRDRC